MNTDLLDVLIYEKIKKNESENQDSLNYLQLEIPSYVPENLNEEKKEEKRVIEIQF